MIARPFVGEDSRDFKRTANRRDYAMPPPEPTLLDRAVAAGGQVIAVGKIGDIFAHRGITEVAKAPNDDALFDATLAALDKAGDGDLVFANFVDFDIALRPSPRRPRLCRGARSVRPAAAGTRWRG